MKASVLAETLDVHQQLEQAAARFTEIFGRSPEVAAVAPGRVNLIGEHTDYNDGFVLPMAIERQTVMLGAPRVDRWVRLVSTSQPGMAEFELHPRLGPGEPRWANYVRGVVAGCMAAGMEVPGFEALIDSNVPVGGGLSSSAALEVATATLIEELSGHRLDPVTKALLCQRAEHKFAGVPCGIMDQFISTMGQAGRAMLLDCGNRVFRMVPLEDPDLVVLIANTHVHHELAAGEYARRRKECERAASILHVRALCDATLELLQEHRAKMEDEVFRRARHVITEIQRTLQAAQAMDEGRWTDVGQLMFESHASLRDDYEVSCRELDILVDLAAAMVGRGVYGSRMTGGGFGGCTVSLVQRQAAPDVAAYLYEQYRARTGIEPTIFMTRAAPGARGMRWPG